MPSSNPASNVKFKLAGVLVICLIGVSALLLRLWNIDWSGPYEYHRDEPGKIKLIGELEKGVHETGYFRHPHFLLTSSAQWLRLNKALGVSVDDSDRVVAVRRWVAILSAMTVILTGLLGYRWRGFMVGAGAAFILAVSPLHVLLSRYIKEDIGLTFWFVLACAATSFLCTTRHKRLWFFLTGSACGGALASKWVGILAFIPVIYEMIRRSRVDRAVTKPDKWRVWLFLLGCLSQWLLWNPLVFHDLNSLGHDFGRSFSQGVLQGHRGISAFGFQYVFTWHLWHSLLPGMGLLVVISGIVGLLMALRKRFGEDGRLIAFFVLVIYFPTEISPLKATLNAERYMAGVLPFLALLAAAALDQWARRLCKSRSPVAAYITSALMLLIVAAPAAANAIAFSKNLVPDNRTLARDWLQHNVPRGRSVVMVGLFQYFPQQLDALGLEVVLTKPVVDDDPGKAFENYDYVCVSSFDLRLEELWPSQRKEQVEFYKWLFSHYQVLKAFNSDKLSFIWPASFARPIEYGFDQPTLWILKAPADKISNASSTREGN